MAGIILNGMNIKDLMLNGRTVSAMLNGELVWPVATPTPVPSFDGYIIQMKWNPVKDENITVNGLWVDGSRISTSDIYDAKYNVGGTDNQMSQEDIASAINSNKSFYARSVEFWVDRNDITRIDWKTNQYYQPAGEWLLNVWTYVKNQWSYNQIITDQLVTPDANVTIPIILS